MKNEKRDLIVLSNNEIIDPIAMGNQVEALNKLLLSVENLHCFCIANEIIDINRYKIIQKPHLIQQMIRERMTKPFVFIFNKN